MNNKRQNKIWLVVYVVVAAILVSGVVLFLMQSQETEDSFPELSLAPGSTFKGQFTDPGNYWQYESGDSCVHSTSLTSTTLSSGDNYYYATEDLTVQEVVDRINCIPQNRIRIMYKDPATQKFYSWPKKAHNETTELANAEDLTILANTAFIITSKDETLMGEIYNVNVPLPTPPVISPAVSPFDTGGPYASVNDIYDDENAVASGWIGLVGTSDGTRMTDDLNTFAIADRVEKVFYKTGTDINSFTEAPIVAGVVPDIDFSAGEHMVWLKLAEPIAPTPTDCGGEDATHSCLTNGSNPAIFTQKGDDACVTSCTAIEASCHNRDGGNPNWISTGESCSEDGQDYLHTGIVDTTSCAFRAVCGSTLKFAPMEVEYFGIIADQPENFCSTSDETALNKCVTTTGNDVCADIGKICSEVGIKNNDNPNNDYLYQFVDSGCDLSIEEVIESLDQTVSEDTDWNVSAVCDTCSFGDSTHICMTTDKDIELNNPTIWVSEKTQHTGDQACGAIGLTCSTLQTSSDGATWSDGLAQEGGGNVECDEFIETAQQVYGISQGFVRFPYIVRAECTSEPETASEPEYTYVSECAGEDETHACITVGNPPQIVKTGTAACGLLGLACSEIQYLEQHEIEYPEGEWDFLLPSNFCDNLIDQNNAEYLLRAECE